MIDCKIVVTVAGFRQLIAGLVQIIPVHYQRNKIFEGFKTGIVGFKEKYS